MIQNEKRNLSFVALFLFICCLSGCATESGSHRFYSGPPLPKTEIALVYAVRGCYMRDVRSETEKEGRHLDYFKDAGSGMLDLLPGEYIIGITYSHSSADFEKRTQTLGDKIRIKLHARPGNVYIIYPSIDGSKWQPIIVNIDDYDMNKCEKHNKYESCPSKEVIGAKTTAYLNSERPVMRFHPLSETPYYKPVTEEAKREIKGFWW